MKLLIVQSGFLGDVILSTATFDAARQLYPDSHISVLTTPAARKLVEYHPAVDEVITFDKRGAQGGLKGIFSMAKILREKSFDIVFSLHKSSRTSLLLWLSGIKLRYGFNQSGLKFFYSKTVERRDKKHDVLRNLAIFRAVGKEPEELPHKLFVGYSKEDEIRAIQELSSCKAKIRVGIAPGSVWATKRWTVEGFSKLAEMFSTSGFDVVLLGGPDDASIGDAILSSVEEKPINLIGKVSLSVSTAVIDSLSLLVTNDSAPLHLASARGVPVVAIFCATVPEFGYGPWQNRHVNVGMDGLSCRPCGRHGGNICPTGTHACQKDLSPERVFEACKSILSPTNLDVVSS